MKLKPSKPEIQNEAQSQNFVVLEVPKAKPENLEFLAQRLYWRGWSVAQIAEEYGIPEPTIYTWKKRRNWDDADDVVKLKTELIVQSLVLLDKGGKLTEHDMKIIDFHTRQIERMARIEKFKTPGGHTGDLNPKIANRNKEPKKKPLKNFISAEHREALLLAIDEYLLEYQKEWVLAGVHRNRFILKSRQIGATNTFALESLKRALETGYNQIFISASRAQANIFRNYICKFVLKHTKIELKGDPLILNIEGITEAPEFHFLGTNYMTAQGYSGDVYIDECFWIYGFKEIKKVASAIATLKIYRRTYFSTPSTIDHEAYAFWNGQEYNRKRSKDERVKIELDCDGIKNGMLCADGIWRQKVTIDDAIAKGNTFIDRDELENEYSIDEFSNLFLCNPLDDSQSAFPTGLVRPCMVDSWEKWRWYRPHSISQKYLGGVWLAIDPSHSEIGDPTAFVIIKPPSEPGGKFYVIDKLQFRGMEFEKMADKIKELMKVYQIDEIIIDQTGIGIALVQLVRGFFAHVKGVNFSPISKSQLVFKGQQVMRKKRIEFDNGLVDLVGALLSIHPAITSGGRASTYKSRRSAENGHGDLAWALLLALSIEPFDEESLASNKVLIGTI